MAVTIPSSGRAIICDAKADVRVGVRRRIVDVEHKSPILRAVVPVAVEKVPPKIIIFLLLSLCSI